MEIKFNDVIYKKNARKGKSLRDLCFNIFKQYLEIHLGLSYRVIQELFNEMHCNNNFVVLSRGEWEEKTENLKNRYFDPIIYNKEELFFTTQWGNNGDNCDNINQMIDFAIKEEFDIEVVNNEEVNIKSLNTKNIMLYGAPGVGKTHNYKKLISMIEKGVKEQDIFKSISTNDNTTDEYNDIFQNIKDEKRIEFVTFHQSYSYEDFIEGFRPKETSNIELEDGIFKLICDRANKQLKEIKHKNISFDEAFEIFRSTYTENGIDPIYSVSNIEIEILEFKEKTIKVQSKKAKDSQYVKKNDLETVVEGIINNSVKKPSDVKFLDVKKDTISLGGLYYPFGKVIQSIIENNQKVIEEKEKNFYIVIDEINRGNISKIFGELITLIEEDKRDDYTVTLPYSKEKFKIPSNLFIIGTMNSTDKSIATIDIALRRRFTFLKMKPNEDLVNFENARILMNKLNIFIGETIGEDYKLGHSYFMKVTNDKDLEFVKEYKITPLLEEYFYVDEDNYNKAINLLTE